jgi:hypothetical protein
MGKKRYDDGGLSQEEKDAGLTQESKNAGLRIGKASGISDAERQAAIDRANAMQGDNSYKMSDEDAINAGLKPAPRATRRAAPTPKASPAPVARAVPGQTSDFTPKTKAYKSPFTPDTSYGEDAASEFLNRRMAATPREEQLPPEPQKPFQKEFIAAKKGGRIKAMASGGMAKSSASKRADGIAQRGHTKGKYC